MKLKKLLSAALSLSLICGAAAPSFAVYNPSFASAAADDGETAEDRVGKAVYVDGVGYAVFKKKNFAELRTTGRELVYGPVSILREVNGIPVTSMARGSFDFEEKVTEIFIPHTLTSLGSYFGAYCHNLTKATVDKDNRFYCSVDGVVYSKDMKKLWICPNAYPMAEFTIPDGVEVITKDAFYTEETIEKLIMPDSLTDIEEYSCDYMKELKSVEFSNNLKTIGNYAFSEDDVLESVDIPASVESIGLRAFNYCDVLNSITINNPNCVIADHEKTLNNNESTVIYGYIGSTAQAYAEKYGYQFKAINDTPVTTTAPVTTTSANTETTTTIASNTTASSANTETTTDSAKASTTTSSTTSATTTATPTTTTEATTTTTTESTTTQTTTTAATTTESATTTATTTASVQPEVTFGDPTGDGKIDAKDSSLVLVEYAKLSTGGESTLSKAEQDAADVNGDGKADAKDASAILSYYAYVSTGGTDTIQKFLKTE